MTENQSLKAFNTFGIECTAKTFCQIDSFNDFFTLLDRYPGLEVPHLILGGGSNVLFTNNLDFLVVKVNTKGIEVLEQDSENVLIRAQAGETWDDFVGFCVGKDWGGLENLSLIPGQVGSSPIQNIGAYGVELKDCMHWLEAIEKKTGETFVFTNSDCNFGYRDSFFKREGRGRFFISAVTFKLTKRNHKLNLSYGGVQTKLDEMGITKPAISDLRQAVINIRESKLPDPKKVGNAGSFFKNPLVELDHFNSLKDRYPQLVAFEVDGKYKLAAGWLIDQAGWKGYKEGDAGVHSQQALVLVNHGNASGQNILDLAKKIQGSVLEKFGVDLEIEVNVI